MPALKSGIEAPAFDLPLLGGGQFSLREALLRSPVVLVFFKVSCPVCQYAFPLYDRLAQKTAGRIRVVGVSQDDQSSTRSFAKTSGVTFPIAIDDTMHFPVSKAYGLTHVPALFEITQDGRIAVSCVGWEKAVVENISHRHADADVSGNVLFHSSESIADFRAG